MSEFRMTPAQETNILIWEGIAAQARKDAAAMIKYAETYEQKIEDLKGAIDESNHIHDPDLC